MNKKHNTKPKVISTLRTLASISSICLLLTALIFFNCKTDTASDSTSDTQSLENMVSITVTGTTRSITSNSIPAHATGEFPNAHNPNAISAQTISVQMTTNPTKSASTSQAPVITVGIATNGVLMEPGTAEVWDETNQERGNVSNVTNAEWNYDGLGADRTGSFVGMDTNKGHVQPTGKYHYHGIATPSKLYSEKTDEHSALVAFAADGYPIFGPHGYNADGSAIEKMYGNYKLKSGAREAVNGQKPKNADDTYTYDGTYTQDYELASTTDDIDHIEEGTQTSILDKSNGHTGKVPASELEKYNYDASYLGTKNADGTYTVYHYHLTDNYPYMPRELYGTPDNSFSGQSGPPPRP